MPGEYAAVCRARLPNGKWEVDIIKRLKDGTTQRYNGVANDPYRLGYENARIGYETNIGFRPVSSNAEVWVIG